MPSLRKNWVKFGSSNSKIDISPPSSSGSTSYESITETTTATTVSDRGTEYSFDGSQNGDSTLHQHNIIIQDDQGAAERWFSLAFALGIPVGDVREPNIEAQKLARKVQKKRDITQKVMSEQIAHMIRSIAKDHSTLSMREKTPFHRDAVPQEAANFGIDQNWKIRLPTPKPTVTVGYTASAFNSYQLELQEGIIANWRGEPCNLARISQTSSGVYWPFFVVEVSDESMMAARQACAGATATCNNALMMLAGSIQDLHDHRCDERLLWGLSRAVQSFSLAIYGKEACLSTHNSEGCMPHAFSTIRTYQLDDEGDVEALAARTKSIFLWAQHGRLASINALLDAFRRRVDFDVDDTDFGIRYNSAPFDLDFVDCVSPSKSKSVFKTVLVDSLPTWARS